MSNILTNWKTTLTGVVVVLLAVILPVIGVKVPGFNMDPGAAITIALGLFLGKDASVTGVAAPSA